MRRTTTRTLVAVLAFLASGVAFAQQIEVPVLVLDSEEGALGEDASELDVRNVVQSAARIVTTVQEAPAIVSVIPQEDLDSQQHRTLADALQTLPGWMAYGSIYNQFPSVLVRGTQQAVLLMVDGLSLFDSASNATTFGRVFPMERVKRIEVVTGPGGVLWGANSFLGVVNVITKTADDIDGVDSGIGVGDGSGDRGVLRGYVLAGYPDLFEDFDLVAHVSAESYAGPEFSMPGYLLSAPFPQPNSPAYYGPEVTSQVPRSLVASFNGSLTYKALSISWQIPAGYQYQPLGFAGNVLREDLPEDALEECAPVSPDDPDVANVGDQCADRGRQGRRLRSDVFDRYVKLQLSHTYGQTQIELKSFYQQFIRRFDPLQSLAPVGTLLEGGVGFQADLSFKRVGASADARTYLGSSVTALYGAEASHAWWPEEGLRAQFLGPYERSRLPFQCPVAAQWLPDGSGPDPASITQLEGCPVSFADSVARTTMGVYAAAQWEVTEQLILYGGGRVQGAPESLSTRAGYATTLIGDAAAVYAFSKEYALKLNYSQGFRPPVFNNLGASGESLQIAGNPELTPERSEAYQVELNGNIRRPGRTVQGLAFRADYSLTTLKNLITFPRAAYINSGERRIHSAEFLAQLSLTGGARAHVGYTWLRAVSRDDGLVRGSPQHWAQFGTAVPVVNDRAELSMLLTVWGSFEDPNRRVDVEELISSGAMNPFPDPSDPRSTKTVDATELVLDRIPPAASLDAGVRTWWSDRKLIVEASVKNALNAQRFQPDATLSYSPRADFLPNPAPRLRFLVTATYHL